MGFRKEEEEFVLRLFVRPFEVFLFLQELPG